MAEIEPDPAVVVGVREELRGEVRELAAVPGLVLRELTNRSLVCALELRGAGARAPPRWAGFLIALEMERRARKRELGRAFADPRG